MSYTANGPAPPTLRVLIWSIHLLCASVSPFAERDLSLNLTPKVWFIVISYNLAIYYVESSLMFPCASPRPLGVL